MSLDQFWVDYDEGCKELAGVTSVDRLIEICLRRFGRSSGDAFFPGGSGDVELLSILMDAGWSPVWVKAHYYFAARQPRDVCKTCHERIELAPVLDNPLCANRWVHSHADKDVYCGTGDGATAEPGDDGITYIEGDIQRGVQRPTP